MFTRLDITYIPYCEIYINTMELISDKDIKDIQIRTEEEMKALEWIINDGYKKMYAFGDF